MARSWWLAVGVFAAALALLSFGVGRAGIASGWVDPVARIAAQDEALYSHTALAMARQGDWLTPRFLGRLAPYKAPALYWFSGLSVKLLGPSRVALRLPSLLAGALIAMLIFVWTRRLAGPVAGLAAAMLFVLNPLAHILARLNLTDMLLAAWIVGALAALGRGRSAVLFGVLSGLAVLTKGVAGLLPLLIFAAWWILAPRGRRPPFGQLALAAAIAAAVVLPWHFHQLVAHPRWFWAEYVLDEILFWGAGTPPQISVENQAWFYLRRLAPAGGCASACDLDRNDRRFRAGVPVPQRLLPAARDPRAGHPGGRVPAAVARPRRRRRASGPGGAGSGQGLVR